MSVIAVPIKSKILQSGSSLLGPVPRTALGVTGGGPFWDLRLVPDGTDPVLATLDCGQPNPAAVPRQVTVRVPHVGTALRPTETVRDAVAWAFGADRWPRSKATNTTRSVRLDDQTRERVAGLMKWHGAACAARFLRAVVNAYHTDTARLPVVPKRFKDLVRSRAFSWDAVVDLDQWDPLPPSAPVLLRRDWIAVTPPDGFPRYSERELVSRLWALEFGFKALRGGLTPLRFQCPDHVDTPTAWFHAAVRWAAAAPRLLQVPYPSRQVSVSLDAPTQELFGTFCRAHHMAATPARCAAMIARAYAGHLEFGDL